MKTYTLDQGRLTVPAIVTGCMRIADMTVHEASAFVHASLDCGVNMFDHADIYGGGKCETIFGEVLKMHPGLRDKMIIQSKCGIGKGLYNASKEHIVKSTEDILSRLGIEQLDILLLHRPDALMEPEEVAEAYTQLHAQGKVKTFGVSNQNAAQMTLLQSALQQKIVFNQMQFSIMHADMVDAGINVNTEFAGAIDRDGGTLDYCRLNNITIQAWSPFQFGFFEGVFVGNSKFPELNAKLEEVAKNHDVTPTTIAVAWILRHPAHMQVVTGTTRISRMEEIAKAADITLSREEWYGIYTAAGHTLP